MTPEEFHDWLNWYFRCFPDHGSWFRSIGKDARDTLLTEWHAILGDYSRRDLTAACHAQLSGKAESAAGYHRSLIAARLKEAADEIRDLRQRKERWSQTVHAPRKMRTVAAESLFDETIEKAGLGQWYRLALQTIDQRCIKAEIPSSDYKRRMEIATEIGRRLNTAVRHSEDFDAVAKEIKPDK